VSEEVGEVLREARIFNRERTLDLDGFLVLRQQKSHRDHQQGNQDRGKNPMVPSPVVPLRFVSGHPS